MGPLIAQSVVCLALTSYTSATQVQISLALLAKILNIEKIIKLYCSGVCINGLTVCFHRVFPKRTPRTT